MQQAETPAKNIHLLNTVDDKELVATRRCIDFPTQLYHDAQETTNSNLNANIFLPFTSLSYTFIFPQHICSKSENKEGGKSKRIQRGYCSAMLPNGEKCYKGTIYFHHLLYS